MHDQAQGLALSQQGQGFGEGERQRIRVSHDRAAGGEALARAR